MQVQPMRLACSILLLLFARPAAAQPPGGASIPVEEVRSAAEEILSSPEFRNLQRLRDEPPAGGGAAPFDPPQGSRGSPADRGEARPAPRSQPSGRSTQRDEQPSDAERDQPYPDGWRGGIEGGRECVCPGGGGGSSTGTAGTAGDAPGGRAGGSRQASDGEAANGEGGQTGDDSSQGASAGEPAGSAGADAPGSESRRGAGESQPGDAGDREGSSQRGPGIRGSNRPYGDGWRGGEHGGRRMVEQLADRGDDRDGAAGRGGSARSGTTDARRTADGRSHTRQPREASESPRRDAERESRMTPPSSTPLGSAVASLFHVLAWIILAGVCGMIAYLIYRALRDYERAEQPMLAPEGGAAAGSLETDTPPGELPADVYVARAKELAQAGQYREAVSQLLLGAMSHIERAGVVRYRRGLTLRDYLRAVRRQKPQFVGMKSMVRVYEPLGFGRREATREHFESSLAGYEQGFRAERVKG